jgi:hypothetical protein
MKWFTAKVVGLAVVAALLGLVSVQETAANYPPPAGSAELTGSSTTASVGGDVTLALTVVDSAGDPVAGKACEVYISSQPGTDASVTQDSAATDADGVITGSLYVGTALGTVQVVANCGNVFAGLSVEVIGVAAPPQAPVEPTQITMPPTGFAPAAGTLPADIVLALLCGGLLALGAGSALRLVNSRTRSGS